MQSVSEQARFRGVLIGTAVGDVVGLPAEGRYAKPFFLLIVLIRGFRRLAPPY